MLTINPASDVRFERLAHCAVDAADGDIGVAQGCLREQYPHAVIRARELSDETFSVWYVYRDGHWVGG